MIRKLLGLAAALLVPSLLAAQTPTIPNDHASPQGTAMARAHSQGAQHRATHRRGEVVHSEDVDHVRDNRSQPEDADHDRDDRSRNPSAATPATRATPPVPSHGAGPATPGKPATPAVPANGRKPTNPGQSGNHRP
jgi:hypothetical protein